MNILNYSQLNRAVHFGGDYIALASTPTEETCTQAGKDEDLQILECTALINQLTRIHGTPPPGAKFFIIRNNHDAGTYYEAAIMYTEEVDIDYLNDVENLPELWDASALDELRTAEHPAYTAKIIQFKAA